MAYISSVSANTYTPEIEENSQQRAVVLDSRRLAIDWCQVAFLASDASGQRVQGGQYTLLINGKSYDVYARRLAMLDETEGLTYEILVAGQRFEVHVEDELERAIGSLKSTQTGGEIIVRAPMPGLVLNILKEAGSSVERGETVALLEAMKMENDLATPHGGTVKEVRVRKGQTVNQGDILV